MAQLAALLNETEGHVRLIACPRCESRRRGITEARGRLVGHCLRCGEVLESPLEVESLLEATPVLRVHVTAAPAI